ncbi:MAG TPA: hypothetical protein VFE32_02900 [Puia sp.]|jgi:hypothetical protein|nr:hypothetical protein [Puia sp.]
MSQPSTLEQIRQLKARNEFSENRRFHKRFTEIDLLLAAVKNHNIKESAAILKYIPSATVACLEGFCRSTLKELIDKGKPYTNRVEDLEIKLQLKLRFSVLLEVQNRSLTMGELIAHVLPCSRLEDINTAFSIVLDAPFLSSLKTYSRHSIFDKRAYAYQYFQAHYSEIYTDIQRLFELRHILSHEIAHDLCLDETEVLRCYQNARIFLDHAQDYIWNVLEPDRPETVPAILEKKRREKDDMDKQVLALLSDMRSAFSPDEHCQENYDNTYDIAVQAWLGYREAIARHKASKTPSGNWGSYAYLQSTIDSSKQMIKSMNEQRTFY